MTEKTPIADIVAEIRVLSAKQDRAHQDIRDIKDCVDKNGSRLDTIEKWISAHNGIVKLVQWGTPIIVALAALGFGVVKYVKRDSA